MGVALHFYDKLIHYTFYVKYYLLVTCIAYAWIPSCVVIGTKGIADDVCLIKIQDSGYGDILDSAQSLIAGAIASGAAEKLLGGILGGGGGSHPSNVSCSFILFISQLYLKMVDCSSNRSNNHHHSLLLLRVVQVILEIF